MKIVEIFKSLQGESSFTGQLCTFIRLTGCNLRCSWCDTTYSFTEGTEMSIDEIMQKTAQLQCSLVEITGGEPLCQKEELLILIDRLLSNGYQVLLETNGSLPLSKIPAAVHKIMDIKLPSSGMADKFDPANLNYLTADDEIKFVIDDANDYSTACTMIKELALDEICRLLISKTGNSSLTHQELADRIITDNLPVTYQIQLHKIIWQDERGK